MLLVEDYQMINTLLFLLQDIDFMFLTSNQGYVGLWDLISSKFISLLCLRGHICNKRVYATLFSEPFGEGVLG